MVGVTPRPDMELLLKRTFLHCVFSNVSLVAFLLLCVTPGPDMELLSKRPVGHTSRHWKAKAVAARANYL